MNIQTNKGQWEMLSKATVKTFGQLPKGVTRPCRVELQERARLVYIKG